MRRLRLRSWIMKYWNPILLSLITLVIISCAPSRKVDPISESPNLGKDPYLWLEEVEGSRALNWVAEQNGKTLSVLKADPRFEQFEQEALTIYEADDKLVYGSIRGEYVYHFWQNSDHVRGIWRRALLQGYLENNPTWETLLDIDALAKAEDENWVYKGVKAFPLDYNRCLVELSRGGKDAVVIREFDISSKTFVEDGFIVPEAKSDVAWISETKIFVATDFGPGTMTSSGYPASVRIWNRGEDLSDARQVAQVTSTDLGIWGWSIFNPEAEHLLISQSIDFWTHKLFLLDEDDRLQEINLPLDADFEGIWKGIALAVLRSEWGAYPAGTLIGLDLQTDVVSEIYRPADKVSILSISATAEALLITIQEDVQGRVLAIQLADGQWISKDIDLPTGGVISIFGASTSRPDFFYKFNNLITPTTLGYFTSIRNESVVLQQAPARFNSENLKVTQEFAISADGTRVPYFLVAKNDLTRDGNNPVLLYGYGGFEISQKPQYRSTTGKLWLEKGGVFALANIRGGGEYGPAWHQAALKQNRHKSFEDFIAIGEDLISRKITRPEKLGIMGGSNGGLLVGAVFTMRPDLFNAVVCSVPLLDMLRYHKLLAGASWIGEYGDPDDLEMRKYLEQYSPYHNINQGTKYPKALFITSTKDDRVHPAHARKMVARLMAQNHPVMYYENMEGGHAAGANLKQYANMAAIEYTYLHQMLMDD